MTRSWMKRRSESIFRCQRRSCTLLAAGIWAAFSMASAFAQSAAPAASCESLAKLALPQATLTMAQKVAAGELKLPEDPNIPTHPAWNTNPAFCRVAATLKPSADSDIKIEVWLPMSGWNGKFLGVGNSGWAGNIVYDGLLEGVQSGYATGSTDNGHEADGAPLGSFVAGHPEKLIDHGNRSVHGMTVDAKAIVKAFYGVAPKYSLFTGCSLGGMQALQEASRYPADYEGIVAGAPANPITLLNATMLWPNWLIMQNPARSIPDAKYTMIHDAALKACAGSIGRKQGLIEEPDRCHFDPATLLCKGADGPDCLTAPQVDLMKQIYAGPVNPRTKESIYIGVAPGGELQLPLFAGAQPFDNALGLYKYAVFQDPKWDAKSMDFDTAIERAKKDVDPVVRAGANLNEYLHRGGKLMIYIGWTDYHNPLAMIDYYKSVLKNAGDKENPEEAVRLFAIPGMDHCGGGAGCDTFDKLGTIDEWVGTRKAPERILASKVADGKTVRTSALCAYPMVARYKGTGDTEKAESFVCAGR